jgi:hypothetical protein
VRISSVEDVLAQRTKRSTYKTVIANPYLFGVALVSGMWPWSFPQISGDVVITDRLVIVLFPWRFSLRLRPRCYIWNFDNGIVWSSFSSSLLRQWIQRMVCINASFRYAPWVLTFDSYT